jgi:hypothetical protein
VETRIAELEKAGAGTGPGPGAPAAIGTAIDGGEPRASTGTPAQSPAEELADLREVLRLGRHLLEGREVTL